MNQPLAAAPRRRSQRGQGLIEYAVAVVVMIGLYSVINIQIKKTVGGLWKTMAKDIAPGCVGCEPPDVLSR